MSFYTTNLYNFLIFNNLQTYSVSINVLLIDFTGIHWFSIYPSVKALVLLLDVINVVRIDRL